MSPAAGGVLTWQSVGAARRMRSSWPVPAAGCAIQRAAEDLAPCVMFPLFGGFDTKSLSHLLGGWMG